MKKILFSFLLLSGSYCLVNAAEIECSFQIIKGCGRYSEKVTLMGEIGDYSVLVTKVLPYDRGNKGSKPFYELSMTHKETGKQEHLTSGQYNPETGNLHQAPEQYFKILQEKKPLFGLYSLSSQSRMGLKELLNK